MYVHRPSSEGIFCTNNKGLFYIYVLVYFWYCEKKNNSCVETSVNCL